MPTGPETGAFLHSIYGPLVAAAQQVETLHQNGSLVGIAILGQPRSERFGPPESFVRLLRDPECDAALEWAHDLLTGDTFVLPPHCSLELDPTDRSLIAPMEQRGFGVAKLKLRGRVDHALAHLKDKGVAPASVDLTLSVPEAEQAVAINALLRDFFAMHPALGWGGPPANAEQQAEIDRRETKDLEQRLSTPPSSDFILCRAGKLLGYFGFTHQPNHPLLGSCGGVNIVLLPEIQGLGLGWMAYRHMVEAMHALGIETLYGSTSNPAVIRISTRIGRRVAQFVLRRDGPFVSPALIPD